MNERIKLLAEQAHEFAVSIYEKRLETEKSSNVFFYKIKDKKFAQLIVAECAEVCYDHSNAAGGVDTHFGYGYKDCGDDIKRHFGIK